MVRIGCAGVGLQLLCKYLCRWLNQPPCRSTPYYFRERVREREGVRKREGERQCVFASVERRGARERHDDFYITPTAVSLGNPLEFLSLLRYYIPISRIRLYIKQCVCEHWTG